MNTVMLTAGVEAGAEVAKSAMETVIAAMADVFTLSGTVVTEITEAAHPAVLSRCWSGSCGYRHLRSSEERRPRLIQTSPAGRVKPAPHFLFLLERGFIYE